MTASEVQVYLWHGMAAGSPTDWVFSAFVLDLSGLTATVATRGFTTLRAGKVASVRGSKVIGSLVPAATMTQCMGQWQLELFYKRKQDLTDKILPFLRENSLHRLNITNKVCWECARRTQFRHDRHQTLRMESAEQKGRPA